jgi:hypothetical protein
MGRAGGHDFVVVIPVADRPRHLALCLQSLLDLLRRHPYPAEVSVLLAEDSLDADNVSRHIALAEEFCRLGLPVHHLGGEAQRALADALPATLRDSLVGVLGRRDQAYARKGAALTRNLAYLWLQRLARDGRRRLFWFVDSDQEFRVDAGDLPGHDLDYLHWLDRIFSETDACLLTGKVVGDPPVSPAVMAGTCLEDVHAFLDELAGLPPEAACTFHMPAQEQADNAAYHDMADLFGFQPANARRFACPVVGAHDHRRCLAEFVARLDHFFDGEHPTRRTAFRPADTLASLAPARTLYTGNYVLAAAGLDWFIPFAALRLRMAGPTLGRLLQAELGHRFVSANLPMLHVRTLETIGRAECRPGIERHPDRVDLSDEFERQFFGDVMLFTVEALATEGLAHTPAAIRTRVEAVESRLQERYAAQQADIDASLAHLKARVEDTNAWWRADAQLTPTRAALHRFLDDMRANFGEGATGWERIRDPVHRRVRRDAIAAAIADYPGLRAAWRAALAAA